MVGKRRALPCIALLIALALAGCTDSEPAPVDDPVGNEGETTGVLDATSEVQAPVWETGQYFGQHVFFGAEDTQGTHLNTVVYEVDGSSFYLATDNREFAEFEAIFDIPIVGEFSRTDLSTESFGGPYSTFSFPMRDGKTWSGKVTVNQDVFGNPIIDDVELTATFNPEIRLVASGAVVPGFDIVGTQNGEVLVATNYVPSLGWYGEFYYYNLNSEDPDDYLFRAISMGTGDDFAADLGGVVYVIDSKEVINHFAQTIAPAAEATPAYQESFEIAADATKIMGIVFAFAAGGHGEVDFVAPSGEVHRVEETTDVPASPDPSTWTGSGGGGFHTLPLESGQWEYVHWNAGFVAGGGARIWELTEQQLIF